MHADSGNINEATYTLGKSLLLSARAGEIMHSESSPIHQYSQYQINQAHANKGFSCSCLKPSVRPWGSIVNVHVKGTKHLFDSCSTLLPVPSYNISLLGWLP